MGDARKTDPGVAEHDMITDEVPYDALASLVWVAVGRAVIVARNEDYAEVVIPQLLRSMRETHDSMRAIISAAQKVEQKKHEPTGRWADAVVLARAQFDAVFIGLLLVHDDEKWGPAYYKAGWATDAQRHYYVMRRFRNTPWGRSARNSNIWKLKQLAIRVRVTTKEWIATLADIREKPLRFGAKTQDRIKPFPTPGQVTRLLKGGSYELLADLLWQQWKFLCDPAHAGLSTLELRHRLRDEKLGDVDGQRRNTTIETEIISQSLLPSFVAIMTLVTVFASRHKDDTELLAAVTKAWDLLEKGTFEGGIIWEQWARGAMGILGGVTPADGS